MMDNLYRLSPVHTLPYRTP